MKRYYTVRNPFYPSFKTLRRRWMKRERDREEAANIIKALTAISACILTFASLYNNGDDDHNQN